MGFAPGSPARGDFLKQGVEKAKAQYAWEKYLKPAYDRNQAKLYNHFAEQVLADRTIKAVDVQGEIAKRMAAESDRLRDVAAPDLVNYLGKLPARISQTGLFDRTMLQDWFDYMHHMAGTEATLRTIHNLLGKVVNTDPAGLPIKAAWKELHNGRLTQEGLQTFLSTYAQRLGETFADPKDMMLWADDVTIPEYTIKTLNRYLEAQEPKYAHGIVKLWDKLTHLWGGSVTLPWAAFHGRNHVAGIFAAWSEGGASFSDVLKGHWDLGQALHSQRFEGDIGEYAKEMRAFGTTWRGSRSLDISGESAREALPGGTYLWGLEPLWKGWGKGRWKEKLNPFRSRGVSDELAALPADERALRQFAPMGAGERMYDVVETLNRGGQYIALRRNGFSPAEAWEKVKRAQFDYSEATSFERQYMKRLWPFYLWTRNNLPYQFQKLIDAPGGRTAQTLRAYQYATGESREYTPGWLRERMAIPVDQQGADVTYLMGLGLPIEDLNKLRFAPGELGLSAAKSAYRMAAELHPFLRFPAEQAAGKQFYSGRKLKYLEPVVPGAPPIVTALATSVLPTSRAITTAKQLADVERKGLPGVAANVLTGIKLGTYDAEKWRMIDMRERQKEILEANPLVYEDSYYYVPERLRTAEEAEAAQRDVRVFGILGRRLRKYREEQKPPPRQ